MNIIEKTYSLNGSLTERKNTNRIILHHAAAINCTADDVDRWHKNNGWTCIGYHFFVRKNGEVYRGRKESAVGAHANGSNSDSIGVCFEGNFEVESMPEAQAKAGQELVAYLKNKYGINKVQKHRDVNNTSCPGKNFSFDTIVNGGPEPAPSKKTYIPGPYKNGSKGSTVQEIQRELQRQGYDCGRYGEDGNFGGDTVNAVKRFQKYHGLVVDGIVGPATWNKLFN